MREIRALRSITERINSVKSSRGAEKPLEELHDIIMMGAWLRQG